MSESEQPILERVRTRLATVGTPPTRAGVAGLLRAEAGGLLGDGELLRLLRSAEDELTGAGVLEPLLRDPAVTDVLVNGPDEVWIDRGGGLQRAAVTFGDEGAVRRLATRLATAAGRRLDDACPWVDAALPDGTRLHAVVPPISADGTRISLRALRAQAFTVDELRRLGTLDGDGADLLAAVVSARLAFLISGGTGSGKTTLLSTLLSLAAPAERIVLVEDAAELRPSHPHVLRLLARQPNVEGAGEVTVRDLVRQALRMRPDRIVVGEVRGAEVVDLLTALNTGHRGGAGTVHANSAAEVPARLEALGALGGVSRSALHSLLGAAVDVVIALRRGADGIRRLTELGVVSPGAAGVAVVPAWRRDGGSCPGASRLRSLLAEPP